MNKVFFDTNVLIAFVFYINSLNLKSNIAFEEYSEYFWSSFVKGEFDNRFLEKLDNLSNFYRDFQKYLDNPNQELYSDFDLYDFAKKNYENKIADDVISSINPFWNRYVGIESQISFHKIQESTSMCLKDLSSNYFSNKQCLEDIMQLTPQRTKKYSGIDRKLKSEGVMDFDRTVILDGHDFACNLSEPIDFVTFDDACFRGAENVQMLCFNSIKGKYDFET